jgi:hypothetical protein
MRCGLSKWEAKGIEPASCSNLREHRLLPLRKLPTPLRFTGAANWQSTHMGDGAVTGAVAGAGVGGLIGLGVLAGVIPVIGPAIAAGTLATILTNAAGGAAVAGLSGALIGWGVPEEHAKYYDGELRAGRIVVTVHAGDRKQAAVTILRSHGGYGHESEVMAGSRTM